MKMQLEIRLVTDRTLASAAIRFLSWSDYSHVDFVMLDGRLLGAHLQDGVQIRPKNYGNFTKRLHKVVIVEEAVYSKVMRYAIEQIGKPYDKSGILNFGLHRNWREDDSWFCSELVAAAFEVGGLPLFSTSARANRITPRDIDMSPVLRAI